MGKYLYTKESGKDYWDMIFCPIGPAQILGHPKSYTMMHEKYIWWDGYT